MTDLHDEDIPFADGPAPFPPEEELLAGNGRRVRGWDFNSVPAAPEEEQPLALALEAFIADRAHTAPPLLGTENETIIPAGGLAVVAGQAGVGKTTLVIDLLFHLVAGKAWLEGEGAIPVARPLSVLLIENEGPREQFRRKLEAKRNRWQDELAGELWVQTWRWGAFSIADMDAAVHLGGFCQDNHVDLVVGDPLGTLGTAGVGAPDETRDFIGRLRALGLTDSLAFLFLHHFRKDKASDEIDQISGAWGPHLDALLILKPSRKDQVRLSFPKLRWAAEPRKPMILNRFRIGQAFEFSHEEGDPRALIPEVEEWLERDHEKGQTAADIAKGIGARRDAVAEVLDRNEQIFRSLTGEDAKRLGRARNATVWTLVPGSGTSGTRVQKPPRTGEGNGAPSLSPPIGGAEEHLPVETQPELGDELKWH